MSKGEDTRGAILRKATELASLGGFEGLSVGGLAQAMSMSKSGVFAHFRSKEALDVAVLEHVRERFVDEVLTPAFKARRGVARVEALRDRMADWIASDAFPGGCPLLAATFELDDKPGPARDLVLAAQRDLLAAIAHAARIAVDEGHFAKDTDVDQFAFDVHGAMFASHAATRLLRDPRAPERFRASVARTIDAARS